MQNRGIAPLIALLLACAALCTPAAAMDEDQAGKNDWLQQFVGRVRLARLEGGQVIVATDANALAALSLQDGSLLWRKVLGEGDPATQLHLAGSTVAALAGGGETLLGFDAAGGQAVWTLDLVDAAAAKAPATPGSKAATIVASAAGVQAYNPQDGKPLWSSSLSGEGEAPPACVAASQAGEGGEVWAAALQPSLKALRSAKLSAEGTTLQQGELSSPVQLSARELLVAGAGVAVALSADCSQLCTADLASAKRLTCQPLAKLLPAGASAAGAALLPGSCSSHAVLQTEGAAVVLSLASDPPAVVAALPGAAASGCFASGPNAPVVATATPSAAGLQLQLVSAADGSTSTPQTVAGLTQQHVDGTPVRPAALFVEQSAISGSMPKVLVVFEDDSVALVSGGSMIWVRHEELASITDVLYTELPAPTHENEAAWQASQPSRGEAIEAQFLTLKRQLGLASDEEAQRVKQYQAVTNDRLRPTRDADGFRKQLVVLTSGGKVAALHNGDGRVLWAADFGRAAGLSKLALWRLPHDVQHDIAVVVFGASGDATTATVINAHTGAVLQQLQVPGGPAADVLAVPQVVHDGTADQHVFVVVPPSGSSPAAVLPDTPAAHAGFEAAKPTFSFWRLDQAAGVVRGFGFGSSGSAEERWAVVAAPPGSGLQVLAVEAHPGGEAVYSPARVVGDGSLKFKYLNPNTLLVATGAAAPASDSTSSGSDDAAPPLHVLLLDAVSGRVLFSQAHENARGPVHAVLSENFAVYHFWDTQLHRWQVQAVDLFDASPHEVSVLELAFRESNTSFSSWDAPPLEVARQGFLTKLGVSTLTTTRTARGSTARQILMATRSGQVYMMDRRFVDPRRPRMPAGGKPTPEMQAEGLPPYVSELPLVSTMYATLDRQVAGLRSVVTEPAVLESACLMFAHGLDLFHTRLAPSRSFDMVPDDFPYALLVLIVVAMAGGALVLRAMVARNAVNAKWQ